MPDVVVRVDWEGEALRFTGETGKGTTIQVDGDGAVAPSPVQTLAISLAACSAADVVDILGKMRLSIEALSVRIEADRAPEPPRRYLRIAMIFEVRGPGRTEEAKVRRAVDLSMEKYCSVVHSLRSDIELVTTVVLDS